MNMHRKFFLCLIAVILPVICFCVLSTDVNAAGAGDLTFTLNTDGNSYSVSDCSTTASGVLEIPATHNEKPVTAIANSAFSGCAKLTSVIIPDGVTKIGSSAFQGCFKLISISIPSSVTYIDGWAFYGCNRLCHVLYTGTNAQWNATKIEQYNNDCLLDAQRHYNAGNVQISIESTCTATRGYCSLCSNYFYQDTNSNQHIFVSDVCTVCGLTKGLTYTIDSANSVVTITGYTGNSSSLTIPKVIEGLPVTTIGNSAFKDCTNLISVTIPEDVARIDQSAFDGCNALSTVFYRGTEAQKSNLEISAQGNTPLEAASWHYQVEDAVFAEQDCYYCAKCDDYFLPDGSQVLATIAFLNQDGTEISTLKLPYNASVAEPGTPNLPHNQPNIYQYVFIGWDKEVVNCAGNATYTATYEETYIDYTVTFLDEDGSTITEKTYHWGETVTPPADPTKAEDETYTYTFAGWDKQVVNCTGNATYKATYTSTYIDYIVIFVNEDGTELSKKAYHWGDKVETPATPSKAANNAYTYTFAGWDKQVVNCTGNATYKATYTSTYIDYVVKFLDEDGSTISEKTYHWGKAVEVPADPTKVADDTFTYTFDGWDKAVATNCFGNVTYTATYTRQRKDGLLYSIQDGQVTITGYIGAGGAVTIPSTMEGLPVTDIGSGAFQDCTNLTSITIPDNLISIGKSAFYGCTQLKDVYITDPVAWCKIDFGDSYASPMWAHYRYMHILDNKGECVTNLVLDDSLTRIPSNAFRNCIDLISIAIPESVTYIGESAFRGCSNLESITIPFVGRSQKTTLNESQDPFGYIFGSSNYTGGVATKQYYYDNIELPAVSGNYYIPASLKSVTVTGGGILYGAFSNCTGLTNIVLSDSITVIGKYAFYNCSGLKSITIPGSVTSIGNSALYGCSNLESITIPFVGGSKKTATSSYQYPFGYIFGTDIYAGGVATEQTYYGDGTTSYIRSTYYIPAALKSVTITGGEILYGAFSSCTGLSSIVLPSATIIGQRAFYNCKSLTSITIPNSVTYIGDSAFSGCTGLTSVTIGNGVTDIAGHAFSGCTGLTDITIPNSVTSIDAWAFRNCTELTCVTIFDSVTSVDTTAFDGCSIEKLIVAEGSKAVDGVMIVSKHTLKEVVIPDSVTRIKESAFSDCHSLVSITLPFVGGYKHTSSDASNNLFGYIFGTKSYSGSMATEQFGNIYPNSVIYYIPSSLKSVTITGGDIITGAFRNCCGLTSITLSDHITGIGDYAFYGCTGLTSITIPDGITNIGGYTFYNCTGLTDVDIPDRVTGIGDSAFYGCASLTDITIPDGAITIGIRAFFNCTGLTSVNIPDRVTVIDAYAFSGCSGLTSVTIGCSTTSIGRSAFEGCTALTNVTIDNGVTSIDQYAFSGCTSLTDITIPNSVIRIGYCAFSDCVGLTSVSIGTGVTDIADYAFFNCTGLTEITIPNSVSSINEFAFYNCTGLTRVTIPASVTSIGNYAFENCVNLTDVYIADQIAWCKINFASSQSNPLYYAERGHILDADGKEITELVLDDSVTTIPCYAFKNCTGLTSVTIPNSVTSIGYSAFSGCTGLTSAIYCGTQEQWEVVNIGSYNSCLTELTLQYHSDFNGVCTICGHTIEYTITFQNWNGTILSSNIYHWGDKVESPTNPTKVADNTYTYAFAGWDTAVVTNCVGNATYKATYTSTYINYTVVFVDEDGTELSKKTYHWGEVVTAPINPTKAADNTYTYAFAGWNKAVVTNCAGNATYKATYTPTYINYTVKFLDEDGSTISEKTYHWGDQVTVPANPTKAADNTYTYAFTGWDTAVVANCAGNATYTATYTSTYIDYTVIFKNWNGTVLSTKTYHYGDAVSVPANPTRPNDSGYSYTFTGWDKTVVNCAGNATYTAVYSATSLVPSTITSNKHTVSGSIISKIGVGTTAETLLGNLGEGRYARIYQGNQTVANSALIGTGMVVKIMDGSTVKVSATVVVTGDANGDGKINITDMLAAKAHLLNKSKLSGVYAQAADTNGDGKINITDFIQMKAHILGKSKVEPQTVVMTAAV